MGIKANGRDVYEGNAENVCYDDAVDDDDADDASNAYDAYEVVSVAALGGVISMLVYMMYMVMMLRFIMAYMKGLQFTFSPPKVSFKVNVTPGVCMDDVSIQADSGDTQAYYAIINWGSENLITSDNDIIHPNQVVIKPFKGELKHSFTIFPSCYPTCYIEKFRFTIEWGVCKDSECDSRVKEGSRTFVIDCKQPAGEY